MKYKNIILSMKNNVYMYLKILIKILSILNKNN